MINKKYYIYNTLAAKAIVSEEDQTVKWELLPPFDLLLMGMDNEIRVTNHSEENYGITTVADLKIKVYGDDTFRYG